MLRVPGSTGMPNCALQVAVASYDMIHIPCNNGVSERAFLFSRASMLAEDDDSLGYRESRPLL